VLVLEKSADRSVMQMVIEEGRNRQIRRMCEAVGLQVKRLRRTSIGPIKLGMLQPGQWRELSASEVGALRNAAGGTAVQETAKPAAKPRRRNFGR
jgi:23S rRNA pseudouridine2605 synthase